MGKTRIRLTENDLHNVISECVKKVIKEGWSWGASYGNDKYGNGEVTSRRGGGYDPCDDVRGKWKAEDNAWQEKMNNAGRDDEEVMNWYRRHIDDVRDCYPGYANQSPKWLYNKFKNSF